LDLEIGKEFRDICAQILAEQKTSDDWAAEESDDMFQSVSFSGGYDADEDAFCFSYYDEQQNEFWFQLTLDEVREVAAGTRTRLTIRPAE
jgi:hypothetical protein